MTVPLVILAAGAAGLGFLESPFDRYVRFPGVEAPASSAPLLVVSVLVALAGWAAAGAIYYWRILPSAVLRRYLRAPYTLLVHKYYVDDLYGWVFLRAGGLVVLLAGAFDRYVVDGIVNAVAPNPSSHFGFGSASAGSAHMASAMTQLCLTLRNMGA